MVCGTDHVLPSKVSASVLPTASQNELDTHETQAAAPYGSEVMICGADQLLPLKVTE